MILSFITIFYIIQIIELSLSELENQNIILDANERRNLIRVIKAERSKADRTIPIIAPLLSKEEYISGKFK